MQIGWVIGFNEDENTGKARATYICQKCHKTTRVEIQPTISILKAFELCRFCEACEADI